MQQSTDWTKQSSNHGRGNLIASNKVQVGSGATQPPIQWVPTRGGGQRPGRTVDRSPASSPEIKNEWSCTPTPPVFLVFTIYSKNVTLIVLAMCPSPRQRDKIMIAVDIMYGYRHDHSGSIRSAVRLVQAQISPLHRGACSASHVGRPHSVSSIVHESR